MAAGFLGNMLEGIKRLIAAHSPATPAPSPRLALRDPAAFFDRLRETRLGPTFTQRKINGINAILDAAGALRQPIAHVAYELATAMVETAFTMRPLTEFGDVDYFMRRYDLTGNPAKAAELGNTKRGDGATFRGRGFVQITGRANYARADRLLGLNGALLVNPELACGPTLAAKILTRGMSEGWFTGVSLSGLPRTGFADMAHFRAARRIVNGTDRAQEIGVYAIQMQHALSAGRWS